MVHKDCTAMMIKAGIQPRNINFQALIDHLVTLRNSDSTAGTTDEYGSSGRNNDKEEVKSEKYNPTHKKGNSKYKLNMGEQKKCDMCKISKTNSNVFKIHYT